MADQKRKILFEESVRGLNEQVEAVDRARAAAGVLVTATALVTAFLGGRALQVEAAVGPSPGGAIQHPEITAMGWAAVCCFFGGLVISLLVALPRRTFGFSIVTTHDIHALIDEFLKPTPTRTEDQLYYHLAYWNYANSWENSRVLGRMRTILSLGGVLLVAQAILWLLVLSGK